MKRQSSRGVQPVARGLRAAQDGCECSPTQNREFTQKRFFAHQLLLLFVYLMRGPGQLFFQCGPEMPKGWTPVKEMWPQD